MDINSILNILLVIGNTPLFQPPFTLDIQILTQSIYLQNNNDNNGC